jgi:hypothetical protein
MESGIKLMQTKFYIDHQCYAEKLGLKPKRTHILSFSFLLAYSFFLLILGGCAAYHPVAINEVPFKQHSQTQVDGNVRVTAAVLTNQESEQIFGVNLALRWVQAVWVEVENRDNHNYWLLSSALDPDYYSPNEIAYSSHRWLSLGVNDRIDDDIDEVRNSFDEDMLFSQGLQKIGWAKGMPAVSSEKSRLNLGGDPYFIDGLLLVLLFHRRPISMLEVKFFDWEKPVGRHM